MPPGGGIGGGADVEGGHRATRLFRLGPLVEATPTIENILSTDQMGDRALRAYITNKYPCVGLEVLETDPCSISERAAIQIELEQAGAAHDTALLWLTAGIWKELGDGMSDYAKMADLNFDEIDDALELQIRQIGTGLTSKDVEHFREHRHLN